MKFIKINAEEVIMNLAFLVKVFLRKIIKAYGLSVTWEDYTENNFSLRADQII